jgi:hypothetical protein
MHPTRIFKTPEELEKAWEEYKEHTREQAKQWPKVQYVGKDGYRVEDYPMMPLTLEGFYVWAKKKYGYIKQYFVNKDNLYDDFVTICSYIEDERRANQITGGMLGFFNASITQRLNGLTERTESTNTNIELPFFPDVPKDDSDK